MARALIIGVDSDIAGKLTDEWESKGWTIFGTSCRNARAQEGDSTIAKLEFGDIPSVQQQVKFKSMQIQVLFLKRNLGIRLNLCNLATIRRHYNIALTCSGLHKLSQFLEQVHGCVDYYPYQEAHAQI